MSTDQGIVRILVIDDKPEMAEDARREIEDSLKSGEVQIAVQVEHDFDEGCRLIQQGACDLVVLDLRRDATAGQSENASAGRDVYLQIQRARFVPVVFWTALPDHIREAEMPPLVAVLGKDELERLPEIILEAIDSRAVSVMADIERHVGSILRDHMWTELAPHWQEYTENADSSHIATVLISRLARVLDADRERRFTSHPSYRYLYPPAVDRRGPGDVLRKNGEWWVVLTPACDFEQGKADRVTLARAEFLTETIVYKKWVESGDSKGKWGELRAQLITATRDRHYYLPAFREIPDLALDLQHVTSVARDDLVEYEAVATLASPFGESLLVQFSHYAGRVGVPDIDADQIRARLRRLQ